MKDSNDELNKLTKDDIWVSCKLGREQESKRLQRYVDRSYKSSRDSNYEGSHTLNLDAKWGEGKTHFLNLWRKDLEVNHLVVFFDAWKTDFSSDPLLAFFNSLDETVSTFFPQGPVSDSWKKCLEIYRVLSNTAAKMVYLSSREEMEKSAKNDTEKTLEQYKSQRLVIEQLEHALKVLVKAIEDSSDYHLPLYVFVDELDRCRPHYAITLLERIKHLFNVAGIQFVIATDTEQLEHAVKSVYGIGFDARRYLKRFFDIQYHFPDVPRLKHAEYLFHADRSDIREYFYIPNSDDVITTIFCDFAIMFDWSMRDREQVFNKLKHIALLGFEKDSLHLVPMLFLLGLNAIVSQKDIWNIIRCRSVASVSKYLEETKSSLKLMASLNKYSTHEYVKNDNFSRTIHSDQRGIDLEAIINMYFKYVCLSDREFRGSDYEAQFEIESNLYGKLCTSTDERTRTSLFSDYSRQILSVGHSNQ